MKSSHNDYRMGRSDWLLLLMPGLIWGSSFFFIAEGLDAFQPALITPLRVLFGFLALVALPQSRKHIPIKDLPSIALLGVFWMVIPLSLFPFAEQHVSSSVTGMLNGATPLFVATVASLMHKSFPHRNQLLGLLVGFCGVLLIAIPTANNNSSSKFGVALIMCALCCYGIALNLAVPLQKKHGALPVIVRAQAVALILTAPLGLLQSQTVRLHGIHFLPWLVSALAALVLLMHSPPHWLVEWAARVRRLPPTSFQWLRYFLVP